MRSFIFPILFILSFTAPQLKAEDIELNIFEKAYNEIARFINLPIIGFKKQTNAEQIVLIDYKESFEIAMDQLDRYDEFNTCLNSLKHAPKPILKVVGCVMPDIDISNIYSDYIDKLIEYINILETQCVPPQPLQLPIYKKWH